MSKVYKLAGGYTAKQISPYSFELFAPDGYSLATFSDLTAADALEAARNAAAELAGEETE